MELHELYEEGKFNSESSPVPSSGTYIVGGDDDDIIFDHLLYYKSNMNWFFLVSSVKLVVSQNYLVWCKFLIQVTSFVKAIFRNNSSVWKQTYLEKNISRLTNWFQFSIAGNLLSATPTFAFNIYLLRKIYTHTISPHLCRVTRKYPVMVMMEVKATVVIIGLLSATMITGGEILQSNWDMLIPQCKYHYIIIVLCILMFTFRISW